MAESEDGSSDREKNKAFKCCKTKLASVVVCVNCGDLYHRSCLERKTATSIADTRFECCESKITSKNKNPKNGDNDQLIIENDLLRRLNKEMEDKNNLLYENKRFLEEKVSFYINEIKKYQQKLAIQEANTDPKLPSKTKTYSEAAMRQRQNVRNTGTIHKVMQNKVQKNNDAMNRNISKVSTTPQENRAQLSATEEEEEAHETEAEGTETENNNGGYVYVESRKQRRKNNANVKQRYRKNTKIGEGEKTDEMAATEKRVWLFISRIKRHVTADNVKAYMAKQLDQGVQDFIVRELPTGEQRNKCFMVGADYHHRDEMYKATFWPAGVGFKRFDFQLYKRLNDKQDFGSTTQTVSLVEDLIIRPTT